MSRAVIKFLEPWVKSSSASYKAAVGAEFQGWSSIRCLLDEGQDLDVGRR